MVLYWTVLYLTALHWMVLNWMVLHLTALHWMVLNWMVLHLTALHWMVLQLTFLTVSMILLLTILFFFRWSSFRGFCSSRSFWIWPIRFIHKVPVKLKNINTWYWTIVDRDRFIFETDWDRFNVTTEQEVEYFSSLLGCCWCTCSRFPHFLGNKIPKNFHLFLKQRCFLNSKYKIWKQRHSRLLVRK